ncbi:uncharacterized protein LOC105693639 isoform X3 [Athalia rosae]|uniref:uncharacterized protein LOC105693639 isoform X3 n=1 Tax=Athalia rosae TaxID=37344 RepID=UPI00203449F7|nr:uncharacterized protein LOC105693639 isoform X3 [Athalia rosae]
MKMGEEMRRSRFTKLLPLLCIFAICVAGASALQGEETSKAGKADIARVQRDLDDQTQESWKPFFDTTFPKTTASEIIGDDQDDSREKGEKFPGLNIENENEEANIFLLNRPRKRLRVRVPVNRGDGNHKLTVVRRKPLNGPFSEAQQALPAPRRFIVTRVRTPAIAKTIEYEGRNDETSESSFESSTAPRRRVTVTRRRKIQPTSTDDAPIKARVTRKKLVNVRPILPVTPTPTLTPTLAIITAGFYGTSEDDEDESEEESDDDPDLQDYSPDSSEGDYFTATVTPGLQGTTLDSIENKSNETSIDEEFLLTSSTTASSAVILTDHFFLPSEEEDYYDDEEYDEDSKGEGISSTTEATVPPLTTKSVTPESPKDLNPERNMSGEEKPFVTLESPQPIEIPIITPNVESSTPANSLESNSDESNFSSTAEDATTEPSKDISNVSVTSLLATRLFPSASPPVQEDAGVDSSTESLSSHSTPLSLHPTPIRTDPTPSQSSTPASVSEYMTSVYYSETIVTSTRLRTYTYVVTKLNRLETEVTSSTAVRPKVTTLTLTVPVTATLPLAVVATESTSSLLTTPSPSPRISPATEPASKSPNDPSSPTYNPEVIVDDDNATEDPEDDEQGRRFNLATRKMSNGVEVIVAGPTQLHVPRWESASPPATLTLSDAVMMLMPRDKPQEFVTKTCATTFTYLTTFTDQDGSARVSTQHEVVYNTATEERHITDPAIPGVGFTLEASPTLGTKVFETTYAYLDLPVESRATTVIKNTVTAPQKYLDLVLEPSEAPPPETNTYLSTRTLERTITENGKATVHSMNDVVTRLVVTGSAGSPRSTTSSDGAGTESTPTKKGSSMSEDLEPEIVKTYYVTYSYYSTFLEQGSTVIKTNVATSSDVVTEKGPVRKTTGISETTSEVESPATSETSVTPVILETPTIPANTEPIQIFATKTYLTTFTYFTTLLQAGEDGETSTTVSSRSRIVENVVTESITPSLLNAGYMNVLLTTSQSQKSAIPADKPTEANQVNNVVTGSTIIFFDEEDRIDPTSTSTTSVFPATETVDKSSVSPGPETRPTTPPTTAEDTKQDPETSTDAPADNNGSFGSLGPFGSFGINGLSALGPVITAMAGLLQGKTSATRRNDTAEDAQDHQDTTTQRSPIYIPVSEFADGDIETAESQNIGNRLANLNRNYIPETRHKSSASLANGIPISPGEVITANSDVIIGKPGRIGGPRPPHTYNREDEHMGIRPPPPPSQALLQPVRPHVHRATPDHHETQVQILPARQVFEEHLQVPIKYGSSSEPQQNQAIQKHPQRLILRTDPGHDVMVNDPLLKPPASPGLSKERGKPHSNTDRNPVPDPNEPVWSPEKYRRPWSPKDPLKPVESQDIRTSSSGSQWIRNDSEEAASTPLKVHGSLGRPDSWPQNHDHKSSEKIEKYERPPWAEKDTLAPGNTIHVDGSLTQPKAPEPTSIIRQVVPHVIDRDTGQPLLVNIQPSQVANVVIPQGGNQALIFGDTNEPHITGQYFDDPSPYPEPEVAPGFAGVQKIEHSPQYFGPDNPSEYMVPPPTPQINFKPLPQPPGTRSPGHYDRPGHLHSEISQRPGPSMVKDYGQRRPGAPPSSPPRRTEVETPPHRYILLGKPSGDSRPANEIRGDGVSWKLKTDRKPVVPQPTAQSRPQGHFGATQIRPTAKPHNRDVYLGRPGVYPIRKPQYPSMQPPTPPTSYRPHTKKPDTNLVPPNWTPPKTTFNREQTQGGQETANDVSITVLGSVSSNNEETITSQILHPPPFQVNIIPADTSNDNHLEKIDPGTSGSTESLPVQQSTGENLPTGAVEYHDPSTDPKKNPEDQAYYPHLLTVKPEVQSFGQILPNAEDDRVPEIWKVNTQTERSTLNNDSEIGESQPVGVQTHPPMRGDMTPEPDTDDDKSEEFDFPGNFVTPGTKDSFGGVGSVTTVVGKPLEVEQGIGYGQQQRQPGQDNFPPSKGSPFTHHEREPAIVQGVPFRQDPHEVKRPYEGPMIVKGKPFGVYVDGHVNVVRPYGVYDQRETRRPTVNHDVVQGVPFGHHGNEKVKPQATVHEVPPPPPQRNENGKPSTLNPVDRGDAMDLKPPPVTVVFQQQHQGQGSFGTNMRVPTIENNRPEPTYTRQEIPTMPQPPSPELSPPAKPSTNKDFDVVTGNRSQPSLITGSGNYYEDENGSELNLAESNYQIPHLVVSSGQSRPEETVGSFPQRRPTFSQDVVTGPRPTSVGHSQQPNDRDDLEFSMPVENTGDDNGDSDTQTERPPSMFSGTTRKTPTQSTELSTNLAAPKPAGEIQKHREVPTNVRDPLATKEPTPTSQSRQRPRVPYRDMMPPPLRPAVGFHGNKASGNEHSGQNEGLEPPPLPTDVVGMSPPPPKYNPPEETTTVATRPFLVELLSQDMVPPAPFAANKSHPMQDVVTVQPAVTVSGSVRKATALAKPHVPFAQDVDDAIPVVHGTVDLPVIIEMHGPRPLQPPSLAPETKKSEIVSIYTGRPFESKPISKPSVQPTIITATSLPSSSTVVRPLHTDAIEPSRTSTYSAIVRPTRLTSLVAEVINEDLPATTKRPVRPGWPRRPNRPVFLQPSEDIDTPSSTVKPTQSLSSVVSSVETVAMTAKSSSKTYEAPPARTTTRVTEPEVRVTAAQTVKESSHSEATTQLPPNETDHETVLYVVTTRLPSVSSSTTRTLLLTRTRTLTSTTVETVTETLLQPASPTTILSSSTVIRPIIRISETPGENESIFVVMSDQNPPEPGAEEVEAEYGDEDAEATRDEQDTGGNEIHRVLAGGILGAPVFPREPFAGRCVPECRSSKAEVCSDVDGDSKCVCRPGFARMFPDRPCKPIYTYTLRVGLDRVGRDPVSAYASSLNNKSSNEYRKLAEPTKEALDRTMMQSDLRDLYRGLDVARFTLDPAAGVEFHAQFSENANETRLKEVVRKYLVGNNYSLGGTEVYASRDLETVDAMDFDECATEEGGPHHDCSPHAACFNLRGSYQCSCQEGWADLSDNLPAYPGRVCSQAPLGCAACNNKGLCVVNTNGQEVCECFPWHSGQRCQVNLKVLLIALVTTGIVLLGLLGACVGLACLGRPGRRSGHRFSDRRAIIPGGAGGGDTSSEGSAADLATIPHHVPHVLPAPPQTVAPAPPSKRPKRSVASFAPSIPGIPAHSRGAPPVNRPRDSVRSKGGAVNTDEQRDRSLTVMIPRAKYRSAPQSPQSPSSFKPPVGNLAADERKLLNYLEGGPRPETRKPSLVGVKRDSVCKEIILDQQQGTRASPAGGHLPVGALVSAGFQVSATVTRPADAESTLARSCGETTVETSTKILRNSDILRGDLCSTLARSCGETTIQAPTKLSRVDLGEAGSTLARSCGETTIQPPTKMTEDHRSSREPRDNASDGHTMAERDVGGTLRMPAQRPPFYDPDRASDRESNFDSL